MPQEPIREILGPQRYSASTSVDDREREVSVGPPVWFLLNTPSKFRCRMNRSRIERLKLRHRHALRSVNVSRGSFASRASRFRILLSSTEKPGASQPYRGSSRRVFGDAVGPVTAATSAGPCRSYFAW